MADKNNFTPSTACQYFLKFMYIKEEKANVIYQRRFLHELDA